LLAANLFYICSPNLRNSKEEADSQIDYCTKLSFTERKFSKAVGEMAEWSNAVVLKTIEGHTSGGSNPSLSANLKAFTLSREGFFISHNQACLPPQKIQKALFGRRPKVFRFGIHQGILKDQQAQRVNPSLFALNAPRTTMSSLGHFFYSIYRRMLAG
jgi:hypothetical protein